MAHQDKLRAHADDDADQPKNNFDIERWAPLVANGEVPFPKDLARDQRTLLLFEVNRLRRGRLVRYIARAIASDIERSCADRSQGG